MSNSFELLSGTITNVQKQHEVLSDIVIELNGKVHGSQRIEIQELVHCTLLSIMKYRKERETK